MQPRPRHPRAPMRAPAPVAGPIDGHGGRGTPRARPATVRSSRAPTSNLARSSACRKAVARPRSASLSSIAAGPMPRADRRRADRRRADGCRERSEPFDMDGAAARGRTAPGRRDRDGGRRGAAHGCADRACSTRAAVSMTPGAPACRGAPRGMTVHDGPIAGEPVPRQAPRTARGGLEAHQAPRQQLRLVPAREPDGGREGVGHDEGPQLLRGGGPSGPPLVPPRAPRFLPAPLEAEHGLPQLPPEPAGERARQ